MDGHGGARKGAGRPRILDKFPEQVEHVNDEFARHLKPAFWALLDLIRPAPRYEEKYIPKWLVMRKGIARDFDGSIIRDDKGKPTVVEVQAYPDAGPDEEVRVERKRIDIAPDVRAIKELFERALGRSGISIEEFARGDDGPGIDLKNLSPGDLDALERIARLLAGGQPEGRVEGDRGGEDADRPG
jgi:hypothetical protein